ncbi:glycerol kinase [Clostridium beijerinckii]|uniref:ATP:glycerol 3-phosphotransferase n=1 Tax=Clostridium beijerinckii TaxID=1520 RepID=A0A0B5QUX8_CLOBE|nr:glycerol kinase GlpK [Clostridium beijerinckii]AJH02032.1 glycerol kinase [Clostridium beijerinckii]
MKENFILTIDQSTSATKALIIDNMGNVKYKASKKHGQIYPAQGLVEHNPIEIYENVKYVIKQVLEDNKIKEEEILGLSITNQRETAVVWDKETGLPIYNAIVWQCRRTSKICNELKEYEEIVTEKTGLRLDPYFSGTKIKWILDNVEGAREKANKGELLLGTIDSWLIWKLTNGNSHVTDYTNASRTLLLNIKTLDWDKELLKIFNIPESMLPEIYPSDEIFGETDLEGKLKKTLKICGVIGDSQGALFGQRCFEIGMAKSTFGTGNSIMVNVGEKYVPSKNGIVSTIAYVSKTSANYGIEGIINCSGDAINWIQHELGLFNDFSEFNEAIDEVKNNEGVYLVPAFLGLGIPHWESQAKASLVGISRNTTKKHIMRAALESIAYQVKDALVVIEKETGIKVKNLNIDGGVTTNKIYNQFLADLLKCKIEKNLNEELSPLGAALLCGLGLGMWRSIDEIKRIPNKMEVYENEMQDEERNKIYKGWQNAVKSVLYLTELNK